MIHQTPPYTFTATLKSDGDLPLNISDVDASALHAPAAVGSTTCIGQIPVGSTCDATVTYDPAKLCSPSGLSYDTLTIGVTSNSPQTYDFTQSYTIVLTHKSDDD